MTAAEALQRSIHGVLIASSQLTTLLGGPNVFDDAPQRQLPPYITFGQSVQRGWSDDSSELQEHLLTLHIWSRAGGRREAHAIIGAVRNVLHDADFSLDGFKLVNLRQEYDEVRREGDGETIHGLIRYRAVTEVISI